MASSSSKMDDQAKVDDNNSSSSSNKSSAALPKETTSTPTTTTSWWDSFVKTAKEKSASALEIMRTDLAEFKTTMSTDTSRLVHTLADVPSSTAAAAAAATAPSSSSLFTSLTSALGLTNLNLLGDDGVEVLKAGKWQKKEEEEEKDRRLTAAAATTTAANIHERFRIELKQMQACASTFAVDGAGPEFELWASKFNSDDFKSRISDLLIENSETRLLYSQLVPAQMSNNQFWSRYFFKFNQLEDDYKKRVQLIEKANKTTDNNFDKNKIEENFDWDDDESSSSAIAASSGIDRPEQKKDSSMKPETTTTTTTSPTEQILVQVTETKTINNPEKSETESSISSISSTSKAINAEDFDGDWEKLSDVAENNNKKNLKSSKKSASTDEVTTAAAIATDVDGDQQKITSHNSSLCDEIETARSHGKKGTIAENDWEDWDE